MNPVDNGELDPAHMALLLEYKYRYGKHFQDNTVNMTHPFSSLCGLSLILTYFEKVAN